MKKVYLLYEADWDYYAIISAHKTRKGAEKAQKEYIARYYYPDVGIQEMEVQE